MRPQFCTLVKIPESRRGLDEDGEDEVKAAGRLLPKKVMRETRHLMLKIYSGTYEALTDDQDDTSRQDVVNVFQSFPKLETLSFSIRPPQVFKRDGSEKLSAGPDMRLRRLKIPQSLRDEVTDSLAESKEEFPEWKQPIVSVVEMERSGGRTWEDSCQSLARSNRGSPKKDIRASRSEAHSPLAGKGRGKFTSQPESGSGETLFDVPGQNRSSQYLG
ncbi:uncharacterized protein RSE6_13935 [Rhynchosporium secalis]|uniref:Uncharacterized protein n=1 Tax=Rhynchosporium secalis TaxID=38038 RepID=A0A1E1MU43_RHYSE|nr:uncharacterized protein RSE6_13935 [Rhynchosporium secalis]